MKLALKEWAVVVKALEEGQQILLLRKGGIQEETKNFVLADKKFLLYPTFEHQKVDLVKAEYEPDFFDSMSQWNPRKSTVEIRVFAEVVEDIEVVDEERVKSLAPYHIWVDTVAEERFKWKKEQPLHVLVLRVYKLEKPVTIPIEEAYLGCKSWHEIADDISVQEATPVLGEEQFAQKLNSIKGVLMS
jgi:hypothetical protein